MVLNQMDHVSVLCLSLSLVQREVGTNEPQASEISRSYPLMPLYSYLN